MKTATLEAISNQQQLNRVGARFIIDQVMNESHAPDHMFREIRPGEDIVLPTNYLSEGSVVVPSLEVVTPRGHEARLVTLFQSDPKLNSLYNETAKALKGTRRLDEMTFDATVRILDTSGAEGLHHIHKTRFPHTVYHAVKRGSSSIVPKVYLTRLGMLQRPNAERVPVLGLVGAAKDKAAEYALFKRIGA